MATDLPQQQQQQQQQHPEVAAALLRDTQRALLASLRAAEAELAGLQGAGSGPGGRELERAKRAARQAVIMAAEIVLCTLSASGGDLLNSFPPGGGPQFDVVVVDEAAQALEPATLIPLQLIKPGSGRMVLVGDPRQLPPTVLSKAAEASLLSQSLFERLARAGWPVQLLREQYRSHPAISAFPSRFFYEGQLLNGAGVDEATRGAPFHANLALGPMVVWDCQEGREHSGGRGGRGGGSLHNLAEAQLAATLVSGLLARYRGSVGSIAVISPYKAQVACLREAFRSALGGEAALALANIEFGTVDGFQGREADVVLFSCVRAQPEAAAAAATAGGRGGCGPRIGFLQDVRRMNVGLTRGRRAVWVLCHAETLAASQEWRPLLQEAHARGVLLVAHQPFRRLLQSSDKQLRGTYGTSAAMAAAATVQVAAGVAAAEAAAAEAAAAAAAAAAASARTMRAGDGNNGAGGAGQPTAGGNDAAAAAAAAAAAGATAGAGAGPPGKRALQGGSKLPKAAAPSKPGQSTAAAAAATAAAAAAAAGASQKKKPVVGTGAAGAAANTSAGAGKAAGRDAGSVGPGSKTPGGGAAAGAAARTAGRGRGSHTLPAGPPAAAAGSRAPGTAAAAGASTAEARLAAALQQRLQQQAASKAAEAAGRLPRRTMVADLGRQLGPGRGARVAPQGRGGAGHGSGSGPHSAQGVPRGSARLNAAELPVSAAPPGQEKKKKK